MTNPQPATPPEHNPDGLPEMEDFRFLALGETLQQWDQCWHPNEKRWFNTVSFGAIHNDRFSTYRRRVAKAESESPQPAESAINPSEAEMLSAERLQFNQPAESAPKADEKDAEIARLRELLVSVSEAAWWCTNNHASFQHGDILSADVTFSIVLLGENGHCFHSPSPVRAVEAAKEWLKDHPYVPFPSDELTTLRARVAVLEGALEKTTKALKRYYGNRRGLVRHAETCTCESCEVDAALAHAAEVKGESHE